VYPTALPHETNDETQQVDIVSSKEENITDSESKGISSPDKQFVKQERFLHWHFLTSETKTTWNVVSSVFTSTYVPAVNLRCLPPYYTICPETGK
jgi:hypothetical protein